MVDDKYGLKAFPKLIFQVLVALIVVYSGISINVGAIIGGLSTILSFLFLNKIKYFPSFLDNNIIDQIKYFLRHNFT